MGFWCQVTTCVELLTLQDTGIYLLGSWTVFAHTLWCEWLTVITNTCHSWVHHCSMFIASPVSCSQCLSTFACLILCTCELALFNTIYLRIIIWIIFWTRHRKPYKKSSHSSKKFNSFGHIKTKPKTHQCLCALLSTWEKIPFKQIRNCLIFLNTMIK